MSWLYSSLKSQYVHFIIGEKDNLNNTVFSTVDDNN